MHVVILHTDFNDPGGVGNYYSKIRGKFSCRVTHFVVGSRPDERGIFQKLKRFFSDYFNFYRLLKSKDAPEIVMVNPSLGFKALGRDSVFLLMSKFFGKKCVVFIRGWHESFEKKITEYGQGIFRAIYGRADHFIVLSKNFVPILKKWGIEKPVAVERTIVDDNVVKELNIDSILNQRFNTATKKILFISRILREKGIYETIDSVALTIKEHPKLELLIAGTGPEYKNVRRYVAQNRFKFVKLLGYVRGVEKVKLLKESYILCHPTYGEGMPNTVIECLAFGLPVVTCPVGGIPDFFQNSKNGFLVEDRDPERLSRFILKLLKDKKLYKSIATYNFEAGKNFYASKAAKRLEQVFYSLIE